MWQRVTNIILGYKKTLITIIIGITFFMGFLV